MYKKKHIFFINFFLFLFTSISAFRIRVINKDTSCKKIVGLRFCNSDFFREYLSQWIDVSEKFIKEKSVLFDTDVNLKNMLADIHSEPHYINKLKSFGIKCIFADRSEFVFWIPPIGFIQKKFFLENSNNRPFIKLNNISEIFISIDLIFCISGNTPTIILKKNVDNGLFVPQLLSKIYLKNISRLIKSVLEEEDFFECKKFCLEKNFREGFNWQKLDESCQHHFSRDNFKMMFSKFNREFITIFDRELLFSINSMKLFYGFTRKNRFAMALAGCVRTEGDEDSWQDSEEL